MPDEIFNPETWAQLGVAGLALFILFIFVFMFMWNNNKSNNKNMQNNKDTIDNLALKIDKFSDAIFEMAQSMTQVFVKSTSDQDNNKNTLNQISEGVNNLKSSVDSLAAKTEALLELKCRPINIEQNNINKQ